MKKYFIIVLLVLQLTVISKVFSQSVSINTSGNVSDTSAMLDITSLSKGLLIPRMSLVQKLAIFSPADGLLVYQTDGTKGFYFYNIATPAWVLLAQGSGGITSLNGLTGASQTFSTPGTLGTAPAWSSSGSAHTLNIPLASAAGVTAGLLSNSDYTTLFNNQISNLSVTAPITYGAGVIGITQSSTTDDGYLSAADYNIFNNKPSSIAITSSVLYANSSFTIAGSAATGTLVLNAQARNKIFAGPIAGANVQPTFRSLVPADLPIATTTATTGLGAISVGSGLSITPGGVLSVTNISGGGTVTSASVVSANGLAGTVANATTTPAITLSTTVNGMVKGNGTALSAATSGTDYSPGTASNATGIVKSTTGTGALTTATPADFPTFNQNTTGTASNITGVLNAASHPALTGDVTNTPGTVATTISNNVVSNAKLAAMPANTFKANNTGAAANASDITGTQATAMLNTFTSTAKGLVPASGGGTTGFLRADGTFAVPSGTNAGTVTSVAVTPANGVAGTVATATTTPAITLTLGDITPLSVAASGTVAGSNLSGTNTGDETTATIKTKLGAASATTDGYLTLSDWNTFNNKASAAGAWSTSGNTGLSSGANFLGTADNSSLSIRTNNIERMFIDSIAGSVGIGTRTFDATYPEKFVIDAGTTTSVNALVAKGSINNYLQMNIKNLSSGNSATSDIVATADNGTEDINYVDLGINGSGYTGSAIQTGAANDGYLISKGNDFYMVNASPNKNMLFLTGGTGLASERMRILANGRVGMGVQDPTAPFVVKDTMEIRRIGSLSQLLFTNTSGTGDFRIGGDGGDIFWQGGGGRALQMGSYWTTILGGDRQGQGGAYPAFISGLNGTGVLVQAQRNLSVPLGVQAFSGSQSANLTEWRNSGGTALSAVTKDGNFGIGLSNPSTKLHIVGTNPLTLTGVQTGTNTTADSLLTITNGLVRKLPLSTFASATNAISSLNGLTATTQTFATPGTTGTAPAWTSSGSAHTLNIPLASAASVTVGLISNTDWNTFNNKAGSIILNTSGVLYGATNTFNIAPGGAATGSLTLNTQVANSFLAGPATGGNAAPTFRSIVPADLPVATATTLGAISVGSGLAVNGSGVLSATNTNAGTVTSVSVTSANGVSGTVATSTTTPAITLTLGAITPSSVAALSTVTGSNLSGTNTGDETTATIKAKLGAASATTDGYLTVADWNTFNNKASTANTISSLNGLTANTQTFVTGGTGTDFNIASSGSIHTFNIPDASGTTRGVVTTGTQTIAGSKTFSSAPLLSSLTAGSVPFIGSGGLLSENNTKLFWDATNSRLGIGTVLPTQKLDVNGSINASTSVISQGSIFVDNANTNAGTKSPGLLFGPSNTGEAIASKRTGGNSGGLDFYTSSINRLAITQGGNVGIGVVLPANKLQVSATADPLSLLGVQTGAATDSILTITNGVVRKLLPSALTTSSGNTWTTTGNSGTTASANFIGTTDARGFRVKVNTTAIQGLLVDSLGNVAVGNAPVFTAGNPREKFLVDAGSSSANPTLTGAYNVISGKGFLDGYIQSNIQNLSPGVSASSDIVASNDGATESTNFIDMGINSSGNTSTGVLGGAGTGYLYSTGNDFAIGNGTSAKSLNFFITDAGGSAEKMRIDGTGKVGIGTSAPATALHVSAPANPLTLSGVATGTNTTADSLLTITNGLVRKLPLSTFASATGAGTVTSASVVSANGVSGTVATATTTPAITLTLGAITPSSVAATGTVTGSNFSGSHSGTSSGTNTGDETNATIKTKLGAASALTDGYLTTTDWNNFNNKASATNSWSTTGNLGTTPGTNYLGTSDAQDLVLKANNIERLRIVNAANGVTGTSGDIKIGDANSGTVRSAMELVMREDGDTYGSSTLHLRNRNGENGAIFETIGATSGAYLVDFIFRTGASAASQISSNLRFETRAANMKVAGNTTEWQIGQPDIVNGGPTLVVGAAGAGSTSVFRIGSLGVGSDPQFSAGASREKLLVDAGSTSGNQTPTGAFNVISGKGYLNNYLQLNIQNNSPGAAASSDIVATNDAGTEANQLNFIDMGVNSSGNTSTGVLGGANTAYLYSTGNDLAIGNNTQNKSLNFFTADANGTGERMRINSAGNVGIGTNAPATALQVSASTNPLTLLGVATGTNTGGDSVLTITSGLVRKLPLTTFVSAANTWSTLGNGGTTAGTNFLGTTGNTDLVFKTANTQAMTITSNQSVGIGLAPVFQTAVNNRELLLVDAGVTSSTNVISAKGSINSYLQMNIQNKSAGNAASTDLVATADDGDETNYYTDLGINSSTYNGNYFGMAHDSYAYGVGGHLVMGTATAGKSVKFLAGGTDSLSEDMRIDGVTGNVGMGTRAPEDQLHVAETTASTVTPVNVVTIETNNTTTTATSAPPKINLIRQFPTASFAANTSHIGPVLNFAFRTAGTTMNDFSQIQSQTYNANSRLSFWTRTGMTNGNATGGTLAEAMTLNGTSLGIGIPIPTQTLDVNGSINAAGTVIVDAPSANIGARLPGLQFGGSVSGEAISSKRAAGVNQYDLEFYTNSNSQMVITNSGLVGIGTGTTVAPTSKLTVAGDVSPNVDAGSNLGTTAKRWSTVYAANGTIQTSDRRLKTNIKNLNYGLKEVLALQPVSYNWKKTPNTDNKIGLIAQDVRKVVPEVVKGDEAKENLGMNYAELVPVLINAIKEQQKEIEDLKTIVKKLQK